MLLQHDDIISYRSFPVMLVYVSGGDRRMPGTCEAGIDGRSVPATRFDPRINSAFYSKSRLKDKTASFVSESDEIAEKNDFHLLYLCEKPVKIEL